MCVVLSDCETVGESGLVLLTGWQAVHGFVGSR